MEVTTLALIATATVAATVALPAIANADTGSFVSPSRDIACNMGFACEHQSLRVPGEQTPRLRSNSIRQHDHLRQRAHGRDMHRQQHRYYFRMSRDAYQLG